MSRALGSLALSLFLGALVGLVPVSAEEMSIPRRPDELDLPALEFDPPPVDGLRFELSSGTPVWVVSDWSVPLVEVSVAVRVGGVLDPPEAVGLASLTGAMLRRGGAGQLSALEFDEAVDFLGADIDSFGGHRRSGVSLDCSPEHLDRALALLADALLVPRFESDRLELAKRNLLQSLAQENDSPLRVLEREWGVLLWGAAHPEVRRVSAQSLSRISRDSMTAFHRRHYRPENMVIAVAGAVKAETVLALLEEHFTEHVEESLSQSDRQSAASPETVRPAVPRTARAPGLYRREHTTDQAKITLGHPGARLEWGHRDRPALLVMAEVLGGGGAVSRLRAHLRGERSLVYRVSAGFGIGTESEGDFEVFLETDPGSAAAAVEVAIETVSQMRTELVPENEVELAKATMIDAFPLLFDSAEDVAGRYAEDELIGRPHETWQTWRRDISRVTAKQVQNVARRYLDPRALRVLVVGPWSAIDEGEPALEKVVGKKAIVIER